MIDSTYYSLPWYHGHYLKGPLPPRINASFSLYGSYEIRSLFALYRPEPGHRVVDFGCGVGAQVFAFAPFVESVTGVDFSRDACRTAERLRGNTRNTQFVCADLCDTQLSSAAYDVVLCANVTEHLYTGQFVGMLFEARRILKVGGRLIIWQPYGRHLFVRLKRLFGVDAKSHVDYKTERDFRLYLREAGFRIKVFRYGPSHIPLFHRVETLFMKYLPLFRRRICILAEAV